jgi:FkbM family methyltransferase
MSTMLLYRLLRKIGILRLINLTTSIKVSSSKVKIPLLGETGFDNLSLSEPWMRDVMTTLSACRFGLFVDVGVNVGQTLIKLRSVFPDMEYLGFEPNPICVNYANMLIKENGWENTTIVPVGINAASGLVALHHYHAQDTDSSASIIPDFRSRDSICKTTYVPCFATGDLAFLFKQTITLIKIDVEGAELEVIESFRWHLANQRPYLICEILPAYSTENVERIKRQAHILDILQKLEYRVYLICKDVAGGFVGFKLINDFGVHSDMDRCDYLFAPAPLESHVHSNEP